MVLFFRFKGVANAHREIQCVANSVITDLNPAFALNGKTFTVVFTVKVFFNLKERFVNYGFY